MADLSKILQQESEGIMFPFRTGVQSTTTEQQVYDSATDGIMTVTGQQYTLPEYKGPTATIQYGTEEEGYPRMLREIEQGELPQFRQEDFPKVGEGVMQPSTPVTQPVEPTPAPEVTQPTYDPCPAGYQLVNGVCQPIQQDRGDRHRPTYTGPKISDAGVIEGYTSVLGRYEPDALNATRMLEAEQKYGTELSSKIGEVNQKYRNRGVQIKQESDAEIDRLRKVYGQERIDEDYTLGNDGKYYRVIATSPTLGELAEDAGVAIGEIVEGIVEKGPIIPAVVKDVVNQFKDYFTKEEDKTVFAEQGTPIGVPMEERDAGTTQVDTTVQPEKTPVLTMKDFGGIDNISDIAKDFGTLQTNINTFVTNEKTLQDRLNAVVSESKTANRGDIAKYKRAENNLRREIAENKRNKNLAIQESKEKEREVQSQVNNSKESDFNVRGETFTAHRDSNNKVIGYSKKGSNVVNMAGMPPIGPGQRIKSSGGGNNNRSIGGNQTTKQSVSTRLSSAKSKYGSLATRGR